MSTVFYLSNKFSLAYQEMGTFHYTYVIILSSLSFNTISPFTIHEMPNAHNAIDSNQNTGFISSRHGYFSCRTVHYNTTNTIQESITIPQVLYTLFLWSFRSVGLLSIWVLVNRAIETTDNKIKNAEANTL
jgi:hypothetical protein